jgi:NAD-dependent SIR2 family protein deacetylase
MRSEIEAAAELLAAADLILIGAGAGMSVDAGYDYNEREQFLKSYPYLEKIGVHCRYHSIGFPWPSKTIQWAFYARHLQDVLYTPPPNPAPYTELDALTAHADRWVLTSNADNLFARMGFDAERLWTRQGTYSHLQCLRPCTQEVWDAKPYMEAILPKIDMRTGELTDASLVPVCPRCGGDVFLNVRGGAWFVEAPYAAQEERFHRWLQSTTRGRLVLLDIGTGFSTPSVVRWPMESIAASHPDAHLIRVNPDHPEVDARLRGKATSVALSAEKFLEAVRRRQ